MLPVEKPVYVALAVFIDPPEFVLNLPPPDAEGSPLEVGADASGRIRLTVKVRGAKELQWVKNGIALKEGADGGRISGVTTTSLLLSHMLPRDDKQELQCVAKNKFGVVKSNKVKIRLVGGKVLADVALELSGAPPPSVPMEMPPPPDEADSDDEDAPTVRRASLVKHSGAI